MTSFANMHWPGLYSIVVREDPETRGLTRLYIAKPGGLHPDLTDPLSPFLHHAHAYDFTSTTLVGAVENDVYEEATEGEKFHRYAYDAATHKLEWTGVRGLHWEGTDVCLPGEAYRLHYRQIHRVIFHPCPTTGWFAVKIEETWLRPRPRHCYSRRFLFDLPNKEQLYRPLHPENVQAVLDELEDATGVTP